MAEIDPPGFRRLATDGDDSRWTAEQAALQRQAAARRARGWATSSASDAPVADTPVQARFSPALIGGGLAGAAAAVLIGAFLLPHLEPGLIAPRAELKLPRRAAPSAPIATGVTLPCYVNGVSLGVLPLVDCAAREGQASNRLHAVSDRPSNKAIYRVAESRHPDEEQLTTPKLPRLSLARRVQALPSSTRTRVASLSSRIEAPPRMEAPPRPRSSPSVDKSVPYGDRLDDMTLATVDARPEPSHKQADTPY